MKSALICVRLVAAAAATLFPPSGFDVGVEIAPAANLTCAAPTARNSSAECAAGAAAYCYVFVGGPGGQMVVRGCARDSEEADGLCKELGADCEDEKFLGNAGRFCCCDDADMCNTAELALTTTTVATPTTSTAETTTTEGGNATTASTSSGTTTSDAGNATTASTTTTVNGTTTTGTTVSTTTTGDNGAGGRLRLALGTGAMCALAALLIR